MNKKTSNLKQQFENGDRVRIITNGEHSIMGITNYALQQLKDEQFIINKIDFGDNTVALLSLYDGVLWWLPLENIEPDED